VNLFIVIEAVKFTIVPLWEVIRNGNQKNWVKAAIEDYIQKNQPNVQTMMNEIIADKTSLPTKKSTIAMVLEIRLFTKKEI
jgi:hypothetical protein